MNPRFCHYLWILQLSWLILSADVVSSRYGRDLTDPCDIDVRQKGHYISLNQITVLMNGFSESRIPLLLSMATSYSFLPSYPPPSFSGATFLLPRLSSPLLSQLSQYLSLISDSIHVIRQQSSLVCDDDVEVDNKSLEFAFQTWASNQDLLVGFFVGSHDLDLSTKEWIYTVHPDKFSIVFSRLRILKTEYLFKYSSGGPASTEMQRIADKMQNCEDILMNFVMADEANVGPIQFRAEKLRDYGVARDEEENNGFREVGLSSRKGDHRKMRGFCIREFHRVSRRMPL